MRSIDKGPEPAELSAWKARNAATPRHLRYDGIGFPREAVRRANPDSHANATPAGAWRCPPTPAANANAARRDNRQSAAKCAPRAPNWPNPAPRRCPARHSPARSSPAPTRTPPRPAQPPGSSAPDNTAHAAPARRSPTRPPAPAADTPPAPPHGATKAANPPPRLAAKNSCRCHSPRPTG